MVRRVYETFKINRDGGRVNVAPRGRTSPARTPKTIYRYERAGMLSAIKPNSRLTRYRREEVEALIEAATAHAE